MRLGPILSGLLLTSLLAGPIAIAQESVDEGHVPEQAVPSAGDSATPASGESSAVRDAYTAASQQMHSAMMLPPGNNPDVLFAETMIPHHQGAIDMARIQLQYGQDPELRKLAEAIIAAQEKEVRVLNDWLAKQPAAP